MPSPYNVAAYFPKHKFIYEERHIENIKRYYMSSGPIVGAKERRNHSMQFTSSASLGKNRLRKFVFGAMLLTALTAFGFAQVPSTPTAKPAVALISSASTKDVSNLNEKKQQQIEYFLINGSISKIGMPFLSTPKEILQWKQALEEYFAKNSSYAAVVKVGPPGERVEGLNGENLIRYMVYIEKIENAAAGE